MLITNILLSLILVLFLSLTVTGVILFLKLSSILREFITPPAENQPSPLANTIDAMGTIIARSIVAQIKGFMMGLQSADRRAENAIQGDIAEGLANQNPIGSLLTSFPALRKTLRRNPQLIDMALSALGNKFGHANGNNHSSGTQVKFKL